MPWFRLDDSFDTHPKVLAAGNEAIGLYIRCGTYAARNLTDGYVGHDVVDLYGNETLAATLVRVKLWHRARGGWRIHDYLVYNPTRQEVIHKREVRADAGRKGGVASGISRSASTNNRSKHEAFASPIVQPPARPDPSVVSVVTEGARASPPRAQKPGSSSSTLNGAASRLPSAVPFAEAMEAALHPEGRGRHARQETP